MPSVLGTVGWMTGRASSM